MSKVVSIKRKCSVCGREMIIKVYPDGTYEGGYYFGSVKEAMIELGRYDKRLSDKEYEYWECEECYNRVYLKKR